MNRDSSVPFPPVTTSPVARSAAKATTNRSLPSPPTRLSAPAPPRIVSAPVPPVSVSANFEPVRVVAAPVLLTLYPSVPPVTAARFTAKPLVVSVAVPVLVVPVVAVHAAVTVSHRLTEQMVRNSNCSATQRDWLVILDMRPSPASMTGCGRFKRCAMGSRQGIVKKGQR